jgi:hypothetical protein
MRRRRQPPRIPATPALALRLEQLARDVARLRRLVEPTGYAGHLVDRLAEHVLTLDVMLAPTAAEIVRANLEIGADDELAVEAALQDAERRDRKIRGLLGGAA